MSLPQGNINNTNTVHASGNTSKDTNGHRRTQTESSPGQVQENPRLMISTEHGHSIPYSPPANRHSSNIDEQNGDVSEPPHIEFSTENNSLVPIYRGGSTSGPNPVNNTHRVSTRSEKIQGFLPREFLIFLNLDPEKIDVLMNDQVERHPSTTMVGLKSTQ